MPVQRGIGFDHPDLVGDEERIHPLAQAEAVDLVVVGGGEAVGHQAQLAAAFAQLGQQVERARRELEPAGARAHVTVRAGIASARSSRPTARSASCHIRSRSSSIACVEVIRGECRPERRGLAFVRFGQRVRIDPVLRATVAATLRAAARYAAVSSCSVSSRSNRTVSMARIEGVFLPRRSIEKRKPAPPRRGRLAGTCRAGSARARYLTWLRLWNTLDGERTPLTERDCALRAKPDVWIAPRTSPPCLRTS